MHFRDALMCMLLEKRDEWIYSSALCTGEQLGNRAFTLKGPLVEAKVQTQKASRLNTPQSTAMCGSCQRGAPDQQLPLIHLRLVTNAQTNPDRDSTIIQAGAGFAVAAVCPAVPDFGKC